METADNHDKKSRIQIGGKLRQLRQDAGMSQQKLADLTGMVQPMINRFETGEREIYVDHAKKLAAVFGIAPTDLLPLGINDPVRQSATDTQLADAHARIREMIAEIDRHDELIADLQRRIQELEQARNSQP
jgi:transcriptional regulator with XRE-family HTH domain